MAGEVAKHLQPPCEFASMGGHHHHTLSNAETFPRLPMTTDEYFVDTTQQLDELCTRLKGSQWLALDTEFIREKTYYPQLCLIQVANETCRACVDPLALDDLGPFFDILYDPGILKILHASRQDLEIFYLLRQSIPAPVFDTQIAASVLGYGEQVGYGNLVQELLGVSLDKSHSRTDWRQRPLDEQQIRYALDDVVYLPQIYQHLHTDLVAKQRLDWISDDIADLYEIDNYQTHPENAWKRISGTHRLKSKQLAILSKLAAWREQLAVDKNLPRKWIAADNALVDIARQAPADPQKMQRIRSLPKEFISKHGQTMIKLVAEALQQPQEDWPQVPQRLKLDNEQAAIVDLMMAVVRHQASAHDISAGAITKRGELEQLLLGDDNLEITRGWRARLAGDHLKQLIAGKLTLSIRDGRLQLDTH